MGGPGEDKETLRRNISEIMILLNSMLDKTYELSSINHQLDSWKGKAKELYADKYNIIINELMESLEYSLNETAVMKQKID
ncbi:MAG TPA: hypothetical protein GXZ21_04895 [Clostridiales bacterium]|nr:hypothetical protein [Clostridiales bacterium]